MKTVRKIILSPAVTIIAFVLAACLLLFSTVGGARAALTYFSETYASRVQMYDIGVTLIENGASVSWRNYGEQANGTWDENTGELLTDMLAEGERVQLGKAYDERLSVGNSGTINQYVRVSVYRYWVDQDGRKLQGLSPDYIDLHLVNLDSDWLLDESATTPERTVLYYSRLLDSGEESPPFSDTLTISGGLKAHSTETTLPDGTVKITYDYNGVRFILEAKVDAVQENNAEAAALSAWGREVAIDETAGTLALR